ncbi:MAG: hypothetical protein KDA60_18065, partial [Planctomycetales bacterium]|nr:hypothetical protein [Planctomycetales bacterium]
YGKIRELIHCGQLGTLRTLRYHEGSEFDWPAASAFHFAPGARGVLSDTGIHLLDTICWWLDARPELLRAQWDSHGGTEAVVHLNLRHAECEIEIKLSRLARLANEFEIVGDRGSIRAGHEDWNEVTLRRENGTTSRIRGGQRFQSYGQFAQPLLKNFLNVIQAGAVATITGASTLPAISLVEESYERVEQFKMPWNELWEAACG